MEWPATLNELAKGMNAPRVVVDNAALPSATLVEVDSTSNRHRHLLAAVQTLTDLGLDIKKAYVSSDGPWFMGFFHVSDQRGLKLADPNFVRSICAAAAATASDDDDGGGVDPNLAGLTTLELTGSDRPGILSEVFAVLRDLDCNVVEAKAWTHNGRIACLIFVKDHNSGGRIEEDPGRVRAIDTRLRNVLSGETKTAVAPPRVTHSDRRLHQLMFGKNPKLSPFPSPFFAFLELQLFVLMQSSILSSSAAALTRSFILLSPLCPPGRVSFTTLPPPRPLKRLAAAASSSSSMENPPPGYRRNVGICLANPDNKIFAASRLDIPSAWQMPQGGIDQDEDPKSAAFRELREETGVTSAEIIAEAPHWVTYDFPPEVREKLNKRWGSDWKGQAQKWFLFRFTGKEEEVNLSGDGSEKPEFGEWAWMTPNQLIELTVEFKKPVYEEVLKFFEPHLTDISSV